MKGSRLFAAVVGSIALCLVAAAPQDADPGEPELVLPQVVLRVEDPGVVREGAGLPGEKDLLPPQRVPPLPALEELAVRDIEPPAALQGEVTDARRDSGLAAEAVIGVGTLSHTYGRLGVFRTGEGPRFSLRFLHEAKDGFDNEDPGSGFHRREDRLEASVKAGGERLDVETEGVARDAERGLQEQGPTTSRGRCAASTAP